MREIGSEFSIGVFPDSLECVFPEWLQLGSDRILTFSGRTAIECAISDILHSQKVNNVLMPSYCCSSMIEPLEKAGLHISFYDVFFDEEQAKFCMDLVIPNGTDIVLFCNYFGYETAYPKALLTEFQNRGGIVIEDITHSLLRERLYHKESDYYIASIRKWGALLSGGLCCKKSGRLLDICVYEPTNEYRIKKKNAMLLKEHYLQSGDKKAKEMYMNLFSQCNKELGENYSKQKIDVISAGLLQEWEIASIRQKRRENSEILHKRLQAYESIMCLFELQQDDVPLFVPIICKEEQQRARLRQRLTQEEIYCPIHWPKTDKECKSNLYNMELSLICDQRYTTRDMQRICEVIEDELKK